MTRKDDTDPRETNLEPLNAARGLEGRLRQPFVPPRIERIGPLVRVTTQFAGGFSP
jgi:hypothetical protein